MNFEIYSYGGGDFLRLIFNGIAQIFGDSDYFVALKTAAIIGFLSILIMAAFHRGRLDLQWILAVVMIYMTLVVPKTHIIITDRVIPSNSAVVENLPLGISATASIFSKLGDWLTRSFETVFSLPNEIKYTGNGLLFAQTLVEESTRFEVTNPRNSANLSEFWKSCVYYDLLLGRYSWESLLKAGDIVNFLAQRTSRARAFTYEQTNGEREIITCKEGFNTRLKGDVEAEVTNAASIQGGRLIPNSRDINDAVSRFASSMPVAYRYLTNLSLTNSNIISQNILANSFKRGLTNFASDADAAAAAQDFSLAKAEAERRTTFSVMGKLAKKMLPILHNIFESFIYAIFPIVIIMAMLPNAGRVLSRYAMALFWVNLWPPLYAILHFSASYHGQKAATMAMIQAGEGFATGLSIMTNTELGNILSDYAAITGYLSLSIPMISWLVINASGSMMASLAGRLMEGYDRPVSSAASEASSGNVALGQFSYQNETAFQANSAPQSNSGSISIRSSDGVQQTTTTNGHYTNMPVSSLPLSIDLNSSHAEAIKSVTAETKAYEKSIANEEAQTVQFAAGQLSSLGKQINESKGLSEAFTQSERHTLSNSNENAMRTLKEMAKREGISESDTVSAAQSFGLNAGVGANAVIVKAGVGGQHQMGRSNNNVSSDTIDKVKHIMESDQFSQAVRDDLTKAHEVLGRNNSDWAQTQGESITQTLNQLDHLSLRHSEAIRESEQLSKVKEQSEQLSFSITQKGQDGFSNWAINNKGIPQSELTNLLANSNAGVYQARNEVNNLAHEYRKDLVREHLANTLHDPTSGHNLSGNFESKNSGFMNKHQDQVDRIPAWKDEDRFSQVRQRVGEHPGAVENAAPSTMTNERDDLEKEFNQRKEAQIKEYKEGIPVRMVKDNFKKTVEGLKNDLFNN